jgi:hypothetical protein
MSFPKTGMMNLSKSFVHGLKVQPLKQVNELDA